MEGDKWDMVVGLGNWDMMDKVRVLCTLHMEDEEVEGMGNRDKVRVLGNSDIRRKLRIVCTLGKLWVSRK